jgi:hypothetical protein
MPSAGFESAIPAIELLQAYALDRSGMGMGMGKLMLGKQMDRGSCGAVYGGNLN